MDGVQGVPGAQGPPGEAGPVGPAGPPTVAAYVAQSDVRATTAVIGGISYSAATLTFPVRPPDGGYVFVLDVQQIIKQVPGGFMYCRMGGDLGGTQTPLALDQYAPWIANPTVPNERRIWMVRATAEVSIGGPSSALPTVTCMMEHPAGTTDPALRLLGASGMLLRRS